MGAAGGGRLSKIRIITPITSAGFRNDTPLKAAVPETCEVTSMFLEYGPASVESAVDEVLAGPGIVDAALRAEQDGMEALVIDCMLDPALDAAREAVRIPVIGCGEAAMKAAAATGGYSVVTVLQRQERAFRDLSVRYGIEPALCSVRGIGVPVLALDEDTEASIVATIREAHRAIEEDGARAIIFGCTGMLGFGAPVAEALGAAAEMVIDPLPFAVTRAHQAVLDGATTDKRRFPAPEAKEAKGFAGWPALSDMMAGRK
jgi:allantoin racemase